MTIKESFTCPNCGEEKVSMLGTQILLEDVRFDILQCPECGAQWRAYFKAADIATEMIGVPAPTNDSSENMKEQETPSTSSETVEQSN